MDLADFSGIADFVGVLLGLVLGSALALILTKELTDWVFPKGEDQNSSVSAFLAAFFGIPLLIGLGFAVGDAIRRGVQTLVVGIGREAAAGAKRSARRLIPLLSPRVSVRTLVVRVQADEPLAWLRTLVAVERIPRFLVDAAHRAVSGQEERVIVLIILLLSGGVLSGLYGALLFAIGGPQILSVFTGLLISGALYLFLGYFVLWPLFRGGARVTFAFFRWVLRAGPWGIGETLAPAIMLDIETMATPPVGVGRYQAWFLRVPWRSLRHSYLLSEPEFCRRLSRWLAGRPTTPPPAQASRGRKGGSRPMNATLGRASGLAGKTGRGAAQAGFVMKRRGGHARRGPKTKRRG